MRCVLKPRNNRSARKATLGTLTFAWLVVACSSGPSWEPPAPPERDAEVASILPTGSYEVAGYMSFGGEKRASIEGYVSFGEDEDGVGCEADYLVKPLGDVTGPSVVRAVRGAGGPSWYRDESVTGKPGEWRSGSDPAAPGVLFLFSPAIIASDMSDGVTEGAGTGILCSIPVMPRFMSLEEGKLVYDSARVEATQKARAGGWVSLFVDALGLEEGSRDAYATGLMEISVASAAGITKGQQVEMSDTEEGGFRIVSLRDNKPLVTMDFTPTARREVASIVAKTYFERLREDVEKRGLEAVLEEQFGSEDQIPAG